MMRDKENFSKRTNTSNLLIEERATFEKEEFSSQAGDIQHSEAKKFLRLRKIKRKNVD